MDWWPSARRDCSLGILAGCWRDLLERGKHTEAGFLLAPERIGRASQGRFLALVVGSQPDQHRLLHLLLQVDEQQLPQSGQALPSGRDAVVCDVGWVSRLKKPQINLRFFIFKI